MADLKELEQLCYKDMSVKAQSLVDIQHVQIDTSLPALERLEKYLEDIKNPYYFLCDKFAVRVCFSDGGYDLSTHLKKYFLNCSR